jgi:hypothetical protein
MTKVTHQMLKDFSWASRLLGNGSPFDLGPASYPRAPGDNNYGYVEGPWFCFLAVMSLQAAPRRSKEKLAEFPTTLK